MIHKKEPGRNTILSGFSLVELCVVLVIMGLLASAAVAGLDIVRNAQAKKIVTWVRGWEQSMLSFLDRRGRFAGDADRDGIISGQAREELATAGLQNLPAESILYASTLFVMHIGNNGKNDLRNVMVVSRSDKTLFAGTDLIAMEAIDTGMDDSTDASSGLVRGYGQVTLDGNETVTSLGSPVAAYDKAVALAYFFDRPPSPEDGFLYYDPFDTEEQMSGAVTYGGASHWTVNADGSLNATGSGYALVGDESWEDYTVSAEIALEDGMMGAALLYRATESSAGHLPTGYGVQIDPGLGNQIVLRQYNGTSEEVLAKVDYPAGFDPTASNTVEIQVSGNTHTVSINGQEVITYTDTEGTTYSSGQVGFRTWDANEATMDNLTVSAN